MSRVPALTRDDVPEDKRFIYDEIASSRKEVTGPFSLLLNSPEVARRVAHLGAYIRFESVLPPPVIEMIILTTAREWNCQFEWSYHEPEARRAGVRDEAISSIRDRKAPDGLNDDESVVVKYVLETLREHRVSDDTFKKALARFGAQGVTDMTATLGYYALLAGVLNAFEVDTASGAGPLLPV